MIDIASILAQRKILTLEVKKAAGGLPKSLWDTYSAFANSFGGTIILGIDKDKETNALIPCGIAHPQQLMTDFWNTINNPQKVSTNILLDNHVYPATHEGKTFLVIEVPRADRNDKPVYLGTDPFKGTFRRNHEGDYHCKREEVLAMMRDQAIESADNKVLENIELSDLNAESIQRYRNMFRNSKPSHVWTELSDAEFLIKIGAARKGSDRQIHPTLAGLVFFGDYITITNELPNYFLDYRERLSSDTRWSDRVTSGDGTWSGNIFDFYFKIIDRLTADVKKPFRLNEQLLRIDDTPVHAGLREGLANALIHADFYGRCGIVIDKKFREITISNPGTFRISLDVAIAGGTSDARNPRIFNMFSLINVGERAGSGLCDIFHTWAKNGYQTPVITESLDPDRVTFTLELVSGEDSKADDTDSFFNDKDSGDGSGDSHAGNRNSGAVRSDSSSEDGGFNGNNSRSGDSKCEFGGNNCNFGGNDSILGGNACNSHSDFGGNLGGKSSDPGGKLTRKEFLIYQKIAETPSLTASAIAEELSLGKRTVERMIKFLKDNGYIRREGSTHGKWVILK